MSNDELKQKFLDQLKALELFPNNNEVKRLRSRVERALERIERKEREAEKVVEVIDVRAQANLARSIKLKKHFRYLRLIRNNFPDLKFLQIRKQFSSRRRGEEVSIPDVVWQNPSP